MKWLRIAKVILEWLPVIGQILDKLGKKKAEAKLNKTEKVLETVIVGVEAYTQGKNNEVKQTIKALAENNGVQDKLHEYVKRITKK